MIVFISACSLPFQGDLFSVTAQKRIYTITVKAGGGGLVSIGSSSNSSFSMTANNEEVIGLLALPSTGYYFGSWAIEGAGSLGDSSKAETSFAVRGGNATVSANFTIYTYDVAMGSASSMGETTPAASSVSRIDYGSSLALVAKAAADCYFQSWSATPSANVTFAQAGSASTKATIYGPATISAIFASTKAGVSQTTPASASVAIAGPTEIGSSGGSWTASLSGASGSLSYQWYIDGSTISGASAATYSGTAGVGTGRHIIGCLVTVNGAYSYSGSLTFTAAGM